MSTSKSEYAVASIHQRFHTSGFCVITYVVVALLIITILYCFRKRLCIPLNHPSQAQNSQPTILPIYHKKVPVPSELNDIDTEWKGNI